MVYTLDCKLCRREEPNMGNMKRFGSAGLLGLLFGLCTTVVLAQSAGNVFKDCPACPEMVIIPGGSFLMGSKPDPARKFKPGQEEQPQHNVTVSILLLIYDHLL